MEDAGTNWSKDKDLIWKMQAHDPVHIIMDHGPIKFQKNRHTLVKSWRDAKL
jgi:hypothetical protein